jgi:autoinducer 2-degrading protein
LSDGFVILAEFSIDPGAKARFLELVRANADASVREEPGCRRFDVLLPENGADKVTLYEIYDSPEAFQAHLATAHYAAFRDATANLCAEPAVRRFLLDEHAKPPR